MVLELSSRQNRTAIHGTQREDGPGKVTLFLEDVAVPIENALRNHFAQGTDERFDCDGEKN
jgi:hypothetical protein